MPPSVTTEILLEAGIWPDEKTLEPLVARVCAALPADARGSISFVFSDDASVRTLNRTWRGKDKPTNVLSFPDGDPDENGAVHLGDIVLAAETVAHEATEAAIPFEHHLTHLLLHGCLHLLGYDHMEDAEAREMEELETRILAGMGIKDPYQDAPMPLD